MGCADPIEGGSAHPISVLELTKNEVDESLIILRTYDMSTDACVRPCVYARVHACVRV